MDALSKYGVTKRNIMIINFNTGGRSDVDVTNMYLENLSFPLIRGENYDAYRRRFIKKYSYEPLHISSVIYDAVSLVGYSSKSDIPFDEYIMNPHGFVGFNGELFVKDNGHVKRKYDMFTVRSKVVIPVEN